MQIVVNGEPQATDASTLRELCEALGFKGDARVATAVNGDFVARTERETRVLKDADRIEIVAPRQGG
ncbi:MAG: sulfur carrier protein ThiS [Pseudomonadota bacterium]